MGVDRCNRGREHIMDVITVEDAKKDEQKDHKTAASVFSCGILELPLPILHDIFLRLPHRALLSCKCVCKTFQEVFRDPHFSEDVLIKSSSLPTRLVLRQGQENSSEQRTFFLANLFDLESSSTLPEPNSYSRPYYTAPTIQYQFSSGDGVMLVGSCNGLLCLMPYVYNTPANTYYICNPLLGEFVVTPPVTQEIPDHTYSNFSRFVFCPKTKHYKIVHFSGQKDLMIFDSPEPTVAEIYTIGSESWRSTGEVPSPVSPATLDSCLNGILHWVSKTGKEASDLICSLDLDTENFLYVSPPDHLNSGYLSEIYCINVGVLNGCLCLCYYAMKDIDIKVWVMKNYGVAESWTLEFEIDLSPYDHPHGLLVPMDFQNLVSFLDNGNLLLFQHHDTLLVSYDRRAKTFKTYRNLRSGLLRAFRHVPSLISLKDIADGKCADSVKHIRKTGFGWTGILDIEI